MLWTNILLGIITFLLIIIFGGLCNIDRKLENAKEVRELLENVERLKILKESLIKQKGKEVDMKKYFKVHQAHPNLISVDLIENDITVGGYIVPNNKEAKEFIIRHAKKEGYTELCKTKK